MRRGVMPGNFAPPAFVDRQLDLVTPGHDARGHGPSMHDEVTPHALRRLDVERPRRARDYTAVPDLTAALGVERRLHGEKLCRLPFGNRLRRLAIHEKSDDWG